MLRVELDVYSGRPNPTWILTPRQEASFVERVLSDSSVLSPVNDRRALLGLGYRGFVVRRIKTDQGPWDRAVAGAKRPLPNAFRLGANPDGAAICDWLLKGAGDAVGERARKMVKTAPVILRPSRMDPAKLPQRPPLRAKAGADAPTLTKPRRALGAAGINPWWNCPSSAFLPNIDFFNDEDHVRNNNCYCFGSNDRADVRYALPGLLGGKPAEVMECGYVIDGLKADGWQLGCQPNGLTIALVMWPDEDYHFYRLVTGDPFWVWGHKPGGDYARYTDDCGNQIFQYQGVGWAPNNICRGPYVDLCGYFYQNNATAFVA